MPGELKVYTGSEWLSTGVKDTTLTQSGEHRGAGDGLTLNGNDLDVSPGNGIEIASDKVAVKLDSDSGLALSSSGLKIDDDYKSSIVVQASAPSGAGSGDLWMQTG